MSGIGTTPRRVWSRVEGELNNYFNYFRKNNKKYFKFKKISQIETFSNNLTDKLEGVLRI